MEPSGMYPIWAQTAREFAERLDKLGTVQARLLANKLSSYADEFDEWSKPTTVAVSPDENLRRVKVVGEYMTSYRDALDMFASMQG